MAMHEITVVNNDSNYAKSRLVIPAYEPESTKNEATNSNHASIYHRFRLKTCRNDGAELGIYLNSIILQSHLKLKLSAGSLDFYFPKPGYFRTPGPFTSSPLPI
jgi:hypothetical protein